MAAIEWVIKRHDKRKMIILLHFSVFLLDIIFVNPSKKRCYYSSQHTYIFAKGINNYNPKIEIGDKVADIGAAKKGDSNPLLCYRPVSMDTT